MITPEGQKLRRLLKRQPLADEVVPADDDWMGWANLFIDDRVAHTTRVITPALERGQVVIEDRGEPSTLAYQTAQGGNMSTLRDTHRERNIALPDLVIYFQVPADVALQRIRAAGRPTEFFERDGLLHKVKDEYDEFARSYASEQRIEVIDATPPIAEVTRTIQGIIDECVLRRA